MFAVLHPSRAGVQNPRTNLSTLYFSRANRLDQYGPESYSSASFYASQNCVDDVSLGMCRPVYYEVAQVLSEHIAKGEWDVTISGMAACSVEVIT